MIISLPARYYSETKYIVDFLSSCLFQSSFNRTLKNIIIFIGDGMGPVQIEAGNIKAEYHQAHYLF